MTMTWLARAGFDTSWAHLPTTEFSTAASRPGALAVLPAHGLADHGLGLPIDAEELVAGAILPEACALASGACAPLVLPPLRFGPAPYPAHTWFGVSLETARAMVLELARSVRFAGFDRLLIFSTSPWQRELLDAAARDARVETGLRVYRVHLASLGVDFHPAASDEARAAAQGIAARAVGIDPRPLPGASGEAVAFRPGRWDAPAGIMRVLSVEAAEAVRAGAAERLARLLTEAAWHGRGEPPALRLDLDRGRVLEAPPWRPWGARQLGALTTERLREAGTRPGALAIVPTGAIEQHGPHLPVGVDAMLGQGLLARALTLVPADAPVWVAPPITVGKSNEHADWVGTLTHSADVFWALVRAQIAQLRRLGFRRIAFFNTHGGNSALLVPLIRDLQGADSELRIGMLQSSYRPAQSPQEAAYGFHAGEWETALMLALAPGLVRRARAVCHYPAQLDDVGELRPEGAAVTFGWTTRDIAPQGVMGDALLATSEQGEAWCQAAAASLAVGIRQLTAV